MAGGFGDAEAAGDGDLVAGARPLGGEEVGPGTGTPGWGGGQVHTKLALLNQMGSLLQASLSEEDTYSVIVNVSKQFFPSDSGGLYMMDQSRTMLRRVASWGSSPPESQGFSVDE